MRPNESLISVVIPVFNGSAHVAGAAASVIGQEGVDVECVVVDDGSTDATAAVAAAVDPAIRVISTPNRGVASARNLGAAATSGELIAFLDADDRWEPDRLAVCAQALEDDPGADAVLCAMRFVAPSGERLGRLGARVPPTPKAMLLREVTFPPASSCILVRRETFDRIGGFEPCLSSAADWDLTLRIAETGRLICLDQDLVEYIVRDNSMSHDIGLLARDARRSYELAFSRHPRDRGFRRRARSAMCRMLCGALFESSRDPRALGYAALSIALHPGSAPATVRASLARLRGHVNPESRWTLNTGTPT